jgi:hypothetical protein
MRKLYAIETYILDKNGNPKTGRRFYGFSNTGAPIFASKSEAWIKFGFVDPVEFTSISQVDRAGEAIEDHYERVSQRLNKPWRIEGPTLRTIVLNEWGERLWIYGQKPRAKKKIKPSARRNSGYRMGCGDAPVAPVI